MTTFNTLLGFDSSDRAKFRFHVLQVFYQGGFKVTKIAFPEHRRKEIKAVQDLLNDRPRKVLGYLKPFEVFEDLLHKQFESRSIILAMNKIERYDVRNMEDSFITVALEGSVCAGKSSLLYRLGRTGWNTIEEYREYVIRSQQSFAKFPPASVLVAKRNFEFLLDIEQERYLDCISNRNHKNIVLDRSILTLVAFEKGAARLTDTNIYHWAIDLVLNSVGSGIIWPDRIAFLDISSEEAGQRALLNNLETAAFFFEEEFNHGFREGIFEFSRLCSIPIFTINGMQARQKVFDQFIDKMKIN